MKNSPTNYTSVVENALRSVVRDVLTQVQESGLAGDQHFYISFRTDLSETQLSERLREHHPTTMSIVLQHQFWDLDVGEQGFRVNLSFDNVSECIFIPFIAITTFTDPSAQFGLQFGPPEEAIEELPQTSIISSKTNKHQKRHENRDAKADVVTLNEFRKK